MGINEYNYDLTRAFLTLFSQIVTGLWYVCYPKQCPIMTPGKDWEHKCMNNGKQNLNCCAIDFCIHSLDINMTLLTNLIFFLSEIRLEITLH
jgi:hypothetical protein